jgi:hypothetical protein
MEPTEARKASCDSAMSISRWKLARMARRAPSSKVPASLMRRSRSFWYSRMPLAKMRSMGPDILAFWLAELNSSFRLVPDQKTRSNSSFRFLMRLMAPSLRTMAAQLATEMPSKISTTNWTTKLACSSSETMDMSWFISGLPEQGPGCGRVSM